MAQTNENKPSPDPPSSTRAMTVQSPVLVDGQNGEWIGGPAFEDSATPTGGGMAAYLHALRRRWLIALGMGLLLALSAGAAVWFTHSPTYTAASLLRVASTQQPILFATADRSIAFDVYKGTQMQYLKSRFVLIAALRKPEILKLTTVKQEIDPVAWLAERLSVSFPGEAEIMRVGLTSKDPKEVAALVNAVVQAYMDEVVDVEGSQRRQRLSDLDRIYTDKETELRKQRTDLKQLAKQLGTGDAGALTLKQQITLQQFAALRSEQASVQFQIMRANGELKVKQALRERADKLPVTEAALDALAQIDPAIVELLPRATKLRNLITKTEDVATPGVAARRVAEYREELEDVEQQIEARREELRKELQRRKLLAIDDELAQLQLEIAVLSQQEQQLKQDVEQARKEAEQFGGSSIDVEMMRAEIGLLEGLMNNIADERQKLLIELRSKPRITLIQQAGVPKTPDRHKKVQMTIMAMMAGFLLPVCGIVWWDTRSRRINSSAEVRRGVGLDVIGTVPVIPSGAIRNLAMPSKRNQHWRVKLDESVNSIAARMLHSADCHQTHVILVSSAVSGEGKTTLATQLAMSLARTGHRTVLVDFDLRRPAIDELFALPLQPGVSEVLRNEAKLSEVVQPTQAMNLFVITAGRWSRGGMASLANGDSGALFETLRSQFEFVVVDGSPILPLADARYISQNVDGVVLSVLRDVSRVPRVLAASEVLTSFGVHILGAVVTGSAAEVYYRDSAYEQYLET